MQSNPGLAFHRMIRVVLSIGFLFVGAQVNALPVTVNYAGNVSGYVFQDALLAPFAPVGTPMSMSLKFNETFSDGSYSFADDLGPVSGTMTLGSYSYVFDGVQPYAYYGSAVADVTWVEPRFLGSGDTPPGASFFGLFLGVNTDMTLFGSPRLGFGWTDVFENGSSVTNYGYLVFSGQGTIVPVTQVPEPASISLVALGLGLFALSVVLRRRRFQA